jgi:hypothetical protein
MVLKSFNDKFLAKNSDKVKKDYDRLKENEKSSVWIEKYQKNILIDENSV